MRLSQTENETGSTAPSGHPWIKWALIGGAVILVLGGFKALNDVGNKVESVLRGVRGKK